MFSDKELPTSNCQCSLTRPFDKLTSSSLHFAQYRQDKPFDEIYPEPFGFTQDKHPEERVSKGACQYRLSPLSVGAGQLLAPPSSWKGVGG